MKKHMISTLVLSLALLMVIVQPVLAGLHLFVVNISGESDGYSIKDIRIIGDGVTWAGDIATETLYPSVYLMMGWDSFSMTEKCGGVATQNIQGNPKFINAWQIGDTLFATKKTCSSLRYGYVYGKHVISNGYTKFYDQLVESKNIP